MPSSSKEGKNIIAEWINDYATEIKTVVDLGVGNGTYHKFFSRKNPVLRHCQWIGIEVYEPYIEKFNLKDSYDQIVNQDIRKIDYSQFSPIDIVFAGDVLEHMTKDESVHLIETLLQHSKRIIISIPIVHYPQDEVEGNPYEKHIKEDWSHKEMLETFPKIIRSWQGTVIGVYLLES